MSGERDRPRRRAPLLAAGFALLAALVLGVGGLATARVLRTLPAPRLDLDLPATLTLAPEALPPIPLPVGGSFDLVSSDLGQLAAQAPTAVLPIGSVAKVMTALVVLAQEPLIGDAPGPTYVITEQDVAIYQQVVAEDGSNVPVAVGEQFSERQLLLALLLPSANNIAETLGVWVAGGQTAFVGLLNSEAETLGMTQTHFADASGYSPQTVSTAADLIKLGEAALANPELAALVATTSAVMPDGSTVRNLDTDLGTVPGWLGIKTGSTSEAGGCLLFAAQHRGPLGGAPEVTVVGAVLGQLTASGDLDEELGDALSAAAEAVNVAFEAYPTVVPGALAPPPVSGSLRSAWGTSTRLLATLQSSAPPLEVRDGATLALSAIEVPHLRGPTIRAGTVVAQVTGTLAGTTIATWSVTTTAGLGEPSWEWLLTH
jgi:D-alanyl-D-alanine carboxypeptidase (penicillin-binding protein 5/6)